MFYVTVLKYKRYIYRIISVCVTVYIYILYDQVIMKKKNRYSFFKRNHKPHRKYRKKRKIFKSDYNIYIRNVMCYVAK